MKHFRDIEVLETFDYDEQDAFALIDSLDVQCAIAQRDMMSDDTLAFERSLRNYHAR